MKRRCSLLFAILSLLACPAAAAPFSGAGAPFSGNAAGPGYAHGTWTPAVTASSTAGVPAYTTHVGSYQKIGNFVEAQFDIVLSGWTGTPSGNVTITGLPLTSTATTSDDGGCIITNYAVTGLASLTYGLTGVIAPSATVVTIYEDNNTGVTQLTAAQTGTTPTLIGVCFYHI